MAYERGLEDLVPERLAAAFALAERDLKFFPSIAELRDLAGTQSGDNNRLRQCDEAWKWVMRYIRDHGTDGRAKRGRVLATAPELRFEDDMPAPPIPGPIEYALEAMGGTVTQGLERFAETDSGALGFLRRDFDAAYLRGCDVAQ
jgi:hypothetical protein